MWIERELTRVMPSLYQRLLGENFDLLPEPLRRFHSSPTGGTARGEFRVTRPEGALRRALASSLGLPRATESVPVQLQVIVEGDRERWVRLFGDQRMETIQWADDGVHMEAMGRWSFASDLRADEAGFHHRFVRAWYGPIRVPRRLAPDVEGDALGKGDGWRVDVRIGAPAVGQLLRYEGWVRPV